MLKKNDNNIKTEYVRLFVAFPFPKNLLKYVETIQSRNNAITSLRWTAQQNLHPTILFIGEVRATDLNEIKERIRNEVFATSPFNLDFEKVTLKKGRRNSGMIWLQFLKNELFSELSGRLNKSLEEFFLHPSAIHDPIPHVTLARWKGQLDEAQINFEMNVDFMLPQINHVELWQSVSSEKGVIYRSLESFDLGKNAAAI